MEKREKVIKKIKDFLKISVPCIAVGMLLTSRVYAAGGLPDNWASRLRKKIQKRHVPDWMRNQIMQDLAPFQNGISQASLDQAQQYSGGMGRFKIIKGRVSYTMNNGKMPIGPGICRFGRQDKACSTKANTVVRALEHLLQHCRLPDIDFVLVLTDGTWGGAQPPGPLFSFSKNNKTDEKVILMPDPHMLGQHKFFTQQVTMGVKKYPWHKKMKKAFWRGLTTGGNFYSLDQYQEAPRFKIAEWGQKRPDMVDAKFNGFIFTSPSVEELLIKQGYKYESVAVSEHLAYAYQIQVDGTTAAWSRMYWQLLSNSLMLKQDSDNIQWYYQALRPYKHYVPIESDASDLIEKIEWAQESPEQVQAIIERATEFAQKNLAYDDLLYYLYLLLNTYAGLQDFRPAL